MNRSDRRDSAGQSADLRTRIAAILSRELPGISFSLALADVLIRELELKVTVTSESNDGRFRSFAIEGYWEEKGR